jgi:hypothetical protein
MNMKIRSIFLLVLTGMAVSFMFSCESRKTTEGTDVDSLMIKYQALVDSVDANWSVMIADDDYKHVLMKRLLLEVSYTNNYDKVQFEDLNQKVEQLKIQRYDQKTMADSDLIDAYDSATWNLTDQIILFARSHPRYADYPMMQELIEDINANNNYVLMHRIHYDTWVKQLNAFKKNNADKLMELDPSLETQELPLFQLAS